MQEWLTVILKDDNYWDQNAFNDLMRRGAEYEEQRDDRLFKCATLPTSLYRMAAKSWRFSRFSASADT
jgi:Nucleotide-diphospho-sugar transferase